MLLNKLTVFLASIVASLTAGISASASKYNVTDPVKRLYAVTNEPDVFEKFTSQIKHDMATAQTANETIPLDEKTDKVTYPNCRIIQCGNDTTALNHTTSNSLGRLRTRTDRFQAIEGQDPSGHESSEPDSEEQHPAEQRPWPPGWNSEWLEWYDPSECCLT